MNSDYLQSLRNGFNNCITIFWQVASIFLIAEVTLIAYSINNIQILSKIAIGGIGLIIIFANMGISLSFRRHFHVYKEEYNKYLKNIDKKDKELSKERKFNEKFQNKNPKKFQWRIYCLLLCSLGIFWIFQIFIALYQILNITNLIIIILIISPSLLAHTLIFFFIYQIGK